MNEQIKSRAHSKNLYILEKEKHTVKKNLELKTLYLELAKQNPSKINKTK